MVSTSPIHKFAVGAADIVTVAEAYFNAERLAKILSDRSVASPASPVCCTEYFVLVSVMVFVNLVIAFCYPFKIKLHSSLMFKCFHVLSLELS